MLNYLYKYKKISRLKIRSCFTNVNAQKHNFSTSEGRKQETKENKQNKEKGNDKDKVKDKYKKKNKDDLNANDNSVSVESNYFSITYLTKLDTLGVPKYSPIDKITSEKDNILGYLARFKNTPQNFRKVFNAVFE